MQTQTEVKQYPTHARLGDLVLGPNPRRGKNPASEEMRASIKVKGVIQPVLVRPLDDGRLELRAGFTRYGLAKDVHGEDYPLPVHVREMTDEEAEEFSLIENVQRGGMNPAEEAESAARILARCNGDRAEAARRLGWEPSTLNKRLALMNAVDEVRDALVDENILLGHAELIAALPKDKQAKVLQLILAAPNLPTVTDFKAQIAQLAHKLAEAIFNKDGCVGCPNNSGTQSALFGEAIADGHCTNRECYEQKTEAALVAKKESLKDEFPEIRIVRPGENFTVVKLVAEGDSGVGEDQAKACRACGKYGAAIAGVPGKMGNVYKGLCFDQPCFEQKVKARKQAEADAAKAAQAAEAEAKAKGASPEQAASAGKAAAKKVATVTKQAAAKAQDSTRVKEYRVKAWRRALARHLARDAELNDLVLIGTALSGNGSKFTGSKLQAVFEHLAGVKTSTHSIVEAMDAILTLDADKRDPLRTTMAASVADGVDEHALVALLKRCATDLAESWKLCEEYLNLLTKSEIEVVAEEIGLKAHLEEKAYAKLFTGKKDEMVKKLLTVEGFDYAGKIPANMRWEK